LNGFHAIISKGKVNVDLYSASSWEHHL